MTVLPAAVLAAPALAAFGPLALELPNQDILVQALPEATVETLLMIGWSTLFTALLGLPWGLANRFIAPGGLRPIGWLYQVSSFLVNVGRSMPFIILAIAIIPFTRLLVGTILGWQAAVVPVSLCAIPFYARLVENAVREVGQGRIEAALMAGASRFQVVRDVLLRESLPSLVSGLTVTVIALISCTAMAGAIGAGGLGHLAMQYGYARYMGDVMVAAVLVIVIIVQVIQLLGDFVADRLDHRR